jgi:hypothetical protein
VRRHLELVGRGRAQSAHAVQVLQLQVVRHCTRKKIIELSHKGYKKKLRTLFTEKKIVLLGGDVILYSIDCKRGLKLNNTKILRLWDLKRLKHDENSIPIQLQYIFFFL